MSIGNSPEDERPFENEHVEADHEEARPSIGRALQQARIAAGLTVDDVSSATRVRMNIVHAIEADDFSACGGDVYARGHIRTLAKAVHLDPEPLIAQYGDEHGGRPAPTPAAPLFEAERIRPERRGPNWTAAMVAAIVAVIGFVGFTMFQRRRQRQRGERGRGRHAQRLRLPDHQDKEARRPQARAVRQRHRGRAAGQGDGPGGRRRRPQLDRRQGPQRPDDLRRRPQAGRLQDLPGQLEGRTSSSETPERSTSSSTARRSRTTSSRAPWNA